MTLSPEESQNSSAQDISFDINIANNDSFSEKSADKSQGLPDPYQGYCIMCKTTRMMMIGFRKKLTLVMSCLLFVQVSILTLYIIQKTSLLTEQILAEQIDIYMLYTLFGLELLINLSVLYGRYR